MSRQRSIEKILASEYVSIGELVRITGSRYSTLKFYTEEGMLPFEQEDENMTRRFHREKAIVRINEIKDLKKQGLRIPEIKERLHQREGSSGSKSG
ncbi:helix-turn-helix domain-containing protein [Fredinandcohnia quinoae]|uniref:Helix-turn-helix domain-containing protein n=1 Tax=Fredinandcohnia quinoae TaxID=2918902 RepID=A0AAW5E8K9_9BACI|nr:helix-turn-helix domain-containing protein [Fredinandcohnia sp. SECRCQ15]MCH1625975.1 helix-turn-helix domain-containing protein [Fredinandcohnia sp. SECRCQ15]